MANPASLTITALAENGSIARPAGDTVDTNGTVPLLAESDTGRIMIEINNGVANILTVTVKAGNNPPGIRAGIGDQTIAIAASSARVIGPFEAARFVQANGSIYLQFAQATGSPTATIRAYKLPKM